MIYEKSACFVAFVIEKMDVRELQDFNDLNKQEPNRGIPIVLFPIKVNKNIISITIRYTNKNGVTLT